MEDLPDEWLAVWREFNVLKTTRMKHEGSRSVIAGALIMIGVFFVTLVLFVVLEILYKPESLKDLWNFWSWSVLH